MSGTGKRSALSVPATALSSLAVLALAAMVLLTGCYMVRDPSPGAVSMEAVSQSRDLYSYIINDTADVWLVGVVIDGAFAENVKEILRKEDLRKSTEGPADDLLGLLLELVLKSAVRFEGGRPFFQLKLPRMSPGSAFPAIEDFKITGLPAGKEYFLSLWVLKDPLTDIYSIRDTPLAFSPIHYFDPDEAPANRTMTASGNGQPISLQAGWYYFPVWEPVFDSSGVWTGLSATVWTDSGGIPVDEQPFAISPGGNTPVKLLLSDW